MDPPLPRGGHAQRVSWSTVQCLHLRTGGRWGWMAYKQGIEWILILLVSSRGGPGRSNGGQTGGRGLMLAVLRSEQESRWRWVIGVERHVSRGLWRQACLTSLVIGRGGDKSHIKRSKGGGNGGGTKSIFLSRYGQLRKYRPGSHHFVGNTGWHRAWLECLRNI